ncbi:hypothetical protein [Mesorhizobium norvegicum]|uniref:hypothetical protein n=1 Tax=Mesorhizobium norvegicum TaxID=1085774 RepID=UPI001459FFBB|nr:hypothetical protein [Mesorhizobium norvegicum]
MLLKPVYAAGKSGQNRKVRKWQHARHCGCRATHSMAHPVVAVEFVDPDYLDCWINRVQGLAPFPMTRRSRPLIVADREMVANSMAQYVSNWQDFWKKQTKSCRNRRLDFKRDGRYLAIDRAAALLAMVAGSSRACGGERGRDKWCAGQADEELRSSHGNQSLRSAVVEVRFRADDDRHRPPAEV